MTLGVSSDSETTGASCTSTSRRTCVISGSLRPSMVGPQPPDGAET